MNNLPEFTFTATENHFAVSTDMIFKAFDVK
jgi:hypothetical protein